MQAHVRILKHSLLSAGLRSVLMIGAEITEEGNVLELVLTAQIHVVS